MVGLIASSTSVRGLSFLIVTHDIAVGTPHRAGSMRRLDGAVVEDQRLEVNRNVFASHAR